MSVNFYDGLDVAEILLPRRVLNWILRIAVVALLLLLWSPLLSVDQVATFLVDQGIARAQALLEPIVEQLKDTLPQPPPSAEVTTTLPTSTVPGT